MSRRTCARSSARPGMNNIGMVAWLVEVVTPEYPTGRKLVVIGNDVTIQAGSFGPVETASSRRLEAGA